MGIGVDIADVIEELGVPVIILRSPNNLTEKITYDTNDVTVPFIREHFLNASFAYNTQIVSGDVLQFNGESYLVINKTPDSFEGGVVEYEAVIFKCNLPAGALLVTPAETKAGSGDYTVTQGWTVRKSPIYGLIYKGTRSALLNSEVSAGKETTFELFAFVSASYDSKPYDRLIISSTEYYRVQDVEKYAYPGVHVLSLVYDDRPVYVP